MEVSVEQIKSWKVGLKISSDSDAVEKEIEKLYKQYASKVEVPGFRKGKVPVEVLKAKFGPAIESEAVENAIPSQYRKAVEQEGYRPITEAEVDEVKFESGKSLSFKVIFEVIPDFKVKDYDGLRLSKRVMKPKKGEVENRIELLRQMSAKLTPVGREARTGDHLVVDYEVFDDKKKLLKDAKVSNYSLPLGEIGQKELDEGLLGVKAGDVRETTVTFPSEATDKRVAGKKLPVHMKVKEVKEKEVPELSDDFAKDVGADSLKDLTKKVTEELTMEAKRAARSEWEKEVIDGLIERNEFEPPESVVEDFLNEMEKKERETAVWLAKRVILLEKLAETLSLTAEEDEIEKRVESISQELKSDYKKVRERLELTGRMGQIKTAIRREKTFDHLIEKGKKK